MTRIPRILAATLFALLLPVQGVAAACAQICAQLHAGEAVAEPQPAPGEAVSHGHAAPEGPCHESDVGAGKCCKAHTFLMDLPVPTVSAAPAFFERDFSVARWTSFIPEEPSPPPIGPAPVA